MTRTNRYSYYVLGVLVLGYTVNYLDRYILSILLPAIKADLGLSDAMLGFLVGPAFAVVYASAGIPVARLADTRSRTGVISIGMALWSVFTAASGMVQTSLQLAIARIAVGVGEAAGTAPSHSLISSYFPPERRGSALAIFHVGLYLGMFLGLFLGGTLVERIGWRWTFVVVGLPGVAIALLLRLTVREPERMEARSERSGEPAESTLEGVRLLLGMKAFRYAALGLGISSFGGMGFGFWVPTFLERVHGLPMSQIGLMFGTISPVSAGVSTIVGGFICDRLIKRDERWWLWLPAVSTLVATPLLMLVLLWPDGVQAMWWALPAGIGAMAGPCINAVAQTLAPERMRALGSSILVLSATLIGMGAGPWVVGFASDALSTTYGAEAIRYALIIALVTNPIGALFFLVGSFSLRTDLAEVREA